jgi:hypothetical protein
MPNNTIAGIATAEQIVRQTAKRFVIVSFLVCFLGAGQRPITTLRVPLWPGGLPTATTREEYGRDGPVGGFFEISEIGSDAGLAV